MFREQWHRIAYRDNTVGGSGVQGADVFRQAVKKGWDIRPTNEVTKTGDTSMLILCDVVDSQSRRTLDQVYAAVTLSSDRWYVIGMGEQRDQVAALAERYLKGLPMFEQGRSP